jgi:hypothetical protein
MSHANTRPARRPPPSRAWCTQAAKGYAATRTRAAGLFRTTARARGPRWPLGAWLARQDRQPSVSFERTERRLPSRMGGGLLSLGARGVLQMLCCPLPPCAQMEACTGSLAIAIAICQCPCHPPPLAWFAATFDWSGRALFLMISCVVKQSNVISRALSDACSRFSARLGGFVGCCHTGKIVQLVTIKFGIGWI